VVVLALGIGTAAAIALGAFGAASPAVNPATAVFKLPEPWIGLASKSSPGVTGALVTQVVAGGPADQAGLHRGDVITAVNGQAIARPADVSSVIDAQPVGAEVLLQINRAGQLETVGVILAGQSAGTP
jgi:S1-C subfamily serine protease